MQKEKSIESNCVYMYTVDKYLFQFLMIIYFVMLWEKGQKFLILQILSDNWENSS